jgi:integron integrase
VKVVIMIKIPKDIESFYSRRLKEEVHENLHSNYWKWLRFFLDFCDKYNFPNFEKTSISHFQQKLALKGQKPNQLEEALQASLLFQKYYSSEVPIELSWESALQKLNTVLISRNYSKNTIKIYTRFTRWFVDYTITEIDQVAESDVRQFLNYLSVEKRVSASAQKSAFFSLLFFFNHVLQRDFGDHSHNIRSPKSEKIPVVLSKIELDEFLKNTEEYYRLLIELQYGCGLRITELLELRLKDLDFENNNVQIWISKGNKNRTVPLPQTIKSKLEIHVEKVKNLHCKYSKEANHGGCFLPSNSLASKAMELGWQWLFPAKRRVEKDGKFWQFHLHSTTYSKKIAEVRRKIKSTKQITAHTFRHSYATHLLIYGLDIRSLQELLGHSKVETTMVYLQLVRSLTPKAIISPLDIKGPNQ